MADRGEGRGKDSQPYRVIVFENLSSKSLVLVNRKKERVVLGQRKREVLRVSHHHAVEKRTLSGILKIRPS